MAKQSKYTKELLGSIVCKSMSIADVVRELGLRHNSGGTHSYIKRCIEAHKIDISHFTGSTWNKGKQSPRKKTPSEYLVANSTLQSDKIKKRMLKDGVKEHRCENCLGAEWLNQPMPLELHHIDGDRTNNQLSNLLLLCANCHSITENFSGKSNKK